MKKIKTCILHIGTEKTGSTTIQDFLFHNRRALISKGYLYPKALSRVGRSNHILLTTYAQNKETFDELRESVGLRETSSIDSHRERVREALAQEIRSNHNIDTLIVSNEHCSSRLVDPSEVERLIDFLRLFAQEVIVVVYLRPQHELAVSLYSTRIKVGLPGGDPFAYAREQQDFYDHDKLLRRWEDVVGSAHIKPRIFGRRSMVGSDVVSDFLSTVGIVDQNFTRPAWKNRSLSPRGLEVLGWLNTHFPRRLGRFKNPVRPLLLKLIEYKFSGRGPSIDNYVAEEFFEQFRESNDSVRLKYFPHKRHLFEQQSGE